MLTLEIPTPRSPVWSVVLGVFLALWLGSRLFFVPVLVQGLGLFTSGLGGFLLLFGNFPNLAFFVALWLLAAYIWARMTFGTETLHVTAHTLEVRTRRLWFERAVKHDAGQVRRLRVLPVNVPTWLNVLIGGVPTLAFDYGSRTVRFGRGLDEAEAAQVLEQIAQKFPQYRSSLT
jgi:hypothetical protein